MVFLLSVCISRLRNLSGKKKTSYFAAINLSKEKSVFFCRNKVSVVLPYTPNPCFSSK